MLSLAQIKNKDFSPGQNMSNIEKIIVAFLTPEISLEAIEQAKKISKEELLEGLNAFYDPTTANLFHSCLTWSNVELFLQSENQDLQAYLKEWLQTQDKFKTIKGLFNLQNFNFKVSDNSLQKVLNQTQYAVNLEEVDNFKQQLDLLEESHNQYFDATLVFDGKQFTLHMGEKETITAERVNFWKENLSSVIKASMLCGMIFAAGEIRASDDDTQRAISHATKAVMAQPEVKEAVDRTVKNAEKAAKEFVKETGTTIPATVVGYGIKSAVEGKVQMKGKGLKSLGVPMDYDIAVGFDNSYSLGVGGKNPYMQNSNYKIEGIQNKQEQKIQMKVNFEF